MIEERTSSGFLVVVISETSIATTAAMTHSQFQRLKTGHVWFTSWRQHIWLHIWLDIRLNWLDMGVKVRSKYDTDWVERHDGVDDWTGLGLEGRSLEGISRSVWPVDNCGIMVVDLLGLLSLWHLAVRAAEWQHVSVVIRWRGTSP